jgi:hypothetical protein
MCEKVDKAEYTRSILLALRNPTPAMLAAGRASTSAMTGDPAGDINAMLLGEWQAMIDEALK